MGGESLPFSFFIILSVNFYFTVLSEPSQDSMPGQFLFYRPVRTVTGLIIDEEELSFLTLFYAEIAVNATCF